MENSDIVTSIVDLTRAVHKLSFVLQAISPSGASSQARWLYRASIKGTHSVQNSLGDICARSTDWVLSSKEDVALHFAEFHSDETNRKSTALISATDDLLRAIKRAYRKGHNIIDANQVFIYIIHSSDFFCAKELRDMVKEPHLRCRLSPESYKRLTSRNSEHLYDSEAVFLHKIPRQMIKLCVTLQNLIDRGLLEILPGLKERYQESLNFLSPKGIRDHIEASCSYDPAQFAEYTRDYFASSFHKEHRCQMKICGVPNPCFWTLHI